MKGKSFLFFSTMAVAFGGFLFGFDTALISGVKQPIQVCWQLSDISLRWAMSMALIGAVFGALFSSIPANKFGRKTTLFWTGTLCFVSALGSALSQDVNSFMFFRFISGFGLGICCFTAPKYISEISPTGMKWRLIALFQFNIIFGVIVAYIIIYMLTDMRDNGWRWMFGVEAVPAFVYAIILLMVPRSPHWLIVKKNDLEKARAILARIDPSTVDSTISAIQESRIMGSNSIRSK